jgi:hypothetical protein
VGLIAVIGAALQLIIMLVQKWFQLTDEKKATVQSILKDVPNATDASHITAMFDRIARL